MDGSEVAEKARHILEAAPALVPGVAYWDFQFPMDSGLFRVLVNSQTHCIVGYIRPVR